MVLKFENKRDGVVIEVDDTGVRGSITNEQIEAHLEMKWYELKAAGSSIVDKIDEMSFNTKVPKVLRLERDSQLELPQIDEMRTDN